MIDIYSETWAEVADLAEEALKEATSEILSPMCDERRANYLRGVAMAMKAVLELGAGTVRPAQAPADY